MDAHGAVNSRPPCDARPAGRELLGVEQDLAKERLLAYARAITAADGNGAAPPPLTMTQLALMLQLDLHACRLAMESLTSDGQLDVQVSRDARYTLRPAPSAPPST